MLCRKREPIEAAHALQPMSPLMSLASLRAIGSPRPVTLPRFAVDLDARLEEAILDGLAQTDAAVDDVESEFQAAVLFFGARMQADLADRGVFERIVDHPISTWRSRGRQQ